MTITQVLIGILIFDLGFVVGAVWGGHRHE
jgi:hypothetical protein